MNNRPIEEHLPAGFHTFSFELQGRTEEAANTTTDETKLKTGVDA